MRNVSMQWLVAVGLAVSMQGVQAEGWSFLPYKDAGFEAKPTLAVLYGTFDPDLEGADSDAAVGVELAFDCILLQPPSNRLRQQVSFVTYEDDAAGLEVSTLEINPHYTIDIASGLALGFGPGLGYVMADAKVGEDADLLALQVGGSLQYYRGPLYAGVEARYQFTESEAIGGTQDDLDNFRALAKVGLNF